MPASFQFLPAPRQISTTGGRFDLSAGGYILLDAQAPQVLLVAAKRLQAALARSAGIRLEPFAGNGLSPENSAVVLRVAPERVPNEQGYRIHITPDGILIEGHDPAGVFYGVCTLVQLLEQTGPSLPFIEVSDWPDFAARGVMLDISRDRVYRMEYLYDLIDRLAGWKINQVQLYTEHTFAYPTHRVVWEKASPVTGEEIMALDAYCRERFIELVPNQNSFGHMERWLVHPQYADLAETHEWFETPWGNRMKGPFSLAPENPGSLALIRSLYDDLLPHFTSRMINVGCDETIDLGAGASRDICEKRGVGRVYLDYLLKIYADLKRRGQTMQFWGDIINEHPDLVSEIPRDVIALEWGYEANHPFDENSARYAASGVPFYVCPGTSAWGSLAGRTDNCLGNLLNAAENGLKHGAIGYLNTDWGDSGHWQALPASYLGFAMGAAFSWALSANREADVVAVTSRFAFNDATGAMGRIAYDLGNVYRVPSIIPPNGSALFWALQLRLNEVMQHDRPTLASMEETLEAIDRAMQPVEAARMQRDDAGLIKREFMNTARMMRHAARRIELAEKGGTEGLRRSMADDLSEIIDEYRSLWLARSRPGGLVESAGRLEAARQDYLV